MSEPSRPQRTVARQKTFHSGLTRDFGVVALGLVALSIGLIQTGNLFAFYLANRGVYLVWIGVAVAASALVLLYSVTGRQVTITPDELTYRDRFRMVTIPWTEASEFAEPLVTEVLFRRLYIGNDRTMVCISSLSFPRFDTILAVIRLARRVRYFNEDGFSL